MTRKFWQILFVGIVITLPFACTEHVTDNKPVAIGNKLSATPGILRGLNWSRRFTIDNAPSGHSYNWQAIFTNRDPDGLFDIDPSGLFQFAPALSDSDRTFGFRIVLSDGSGIVDNYDFSVAVTRDLPLVLAIERTHSTFPGLSEYISITKKQGSQSIGRIECSIVFDSIALQFESVEMGSGIAAGGCNWDRIEYSLQALPDGSPDSLYMLRLTAIADNPLMMGGPVCVNLPDDAEIFRIKMMVSSDRRYECKFLPLRFVWTGCQQNAAYSPSGDTVYLPAEICDYTWDGDLGNHSNRLTGFDCDSSYGYSLGGECARFIQDCAPLTETRNLVLWNGGVDVACADSIDIPHGLCLWDFWDGGEFPESVRFIGMVTFIQSYLLLGAGALEGTSDECISETDTNQDNVPLTVADMVYSERIIVGDALPTTNLAPYHAATSFDFAARTVTSSAIDSIGAILMTFITDSTTTVANNSNIEMLSNYRSGELHVLLYSGLDNMTNSIPPGVHSLVTLSADATLSGVAVSDYSGNLLLVLYNKK